MIPALMRLAGKELSDVDRANQLLDKRLNEWLGNQRSSRYLFGWRELRLIERHKPYLIWGTNGEQKKQLLAQSKRRWYRFAWVMVILVLLFLGGLFWWYSPWGQLWQIRRDLAYFSTRVDDDTASVAAIAFAKDENLVKAQEICDKEIQKPQTGAEALRAIAEAYIKLNKTDQAAPLLQDALKSAETIKVPDYKADALSAIAEAYIKLNKTDQAVPLLQDALTSARTIEYEYEAYKYFALKAIAEAISKLKQTDQAVPLLQDALKSAETIKVPDYKADALSAIAEAISKLKQTDQAVPLLQDALKSAETIEDPSDKALALRAIAEVYIKLNKQDQAVPLLQDALKSAGTIEDPSDKALALRAIAEVYIKLNKQDQAVPLLQDALKSAGTIEDPSDKALALRVIAEVYIKLNKQDQAVPLLQDALKSAGTIESSPEADAFMSPEAASSFSKADALMAIAEEQAKLSNWGLAREAVEICPNDACKVESLAKILTVKAEQVHPELEEEEEEF